MRLKFFQLGDGGSEAADETIPEFQARINSWLQKLRRRSHRVVGQPVSTAVTDLPTEIIVSIWYEKVPPKGVTKSRGPALPQVSHFAFRVRREVGTPSMHAPLTSAVGPRRWPIPSGPPIASEGSSLVIPILSLADQLSPTPAKRPGRDFAFALRSRISLKATIAMGRSEKMPYGPNAGI